MQILPCLNAVPCISRSGCNPEKKILLFPEMLQTLIANNACEERKCTQIFHMRYASYLYEDIRQSFGKKSHSTKQTPNRTPNVSLPSHSMQKVGANASHATLLPADAISYHITLALYRF